MKYKTYKDKEEMEFENFKEIEFDYGNENLQEEREELNDLLSLSSNGFEIYEVVKIIDNKVLAFNSYYSRGGLMEFENTNNFKGGETIIIDSGSEEINSIKVVSEEVLDKKYIEEQEKYKDDKNIWIRELDFTTTDTITKESIKDMFEEQIQRRKKQKEEEAKEEAEEEAKEKVTKEQEQTKYENENIYENENLKIEENKIERIDERIYILKKDVNKVIVWDDLLRINGHSDYGYYNSSYKHIEEILLNREIDFEVQEKDDNGNYIKKYDIVFEKDKKKELIASLEDKELKSTIKINGQKIRRAKQQFILYRIKPETTKEEIGLWNKLTGMKIEALNQKYITLSNKNSLNLDISIDIIDDNNFTIKFMTTEKNVDWNYIKDKFFYGGTSRSINTYWRNENILNLIKDLGIKKQDFFDYLKKASIMKELEKNN